MPAPTATEIPPGVGASKPPCSTRLLAVRTPLVSTFSSRNGGAPDVREIVAPLPAILMALVITGSPFGPSASVLSTAVKA